MTLVVVVKCPEGIVLASESRVTITRETISGKRTHHSTFDNAIKLLSFKAPNNFVGAVTYGEASIGLRSPYSFITEFENSLPDNRLSVSKFGEAFSEFFMKQWNNTQPPPEKSMSFFIAGFDENDPYGSIYKIKLPDEPKPELLSIGDEMTIEYGGQTDYIERLRQGYDSDLLWQVIAVVKPKSRQI